MVLQPSDPVSGAGIGVGEEQVGAGSGIRRSTFHCQISGAASLREMATAFMVGGATGAFDYDIATVTPTNPRLPYPMTPAIYITSVANFASTWDVQFRVVGKDQFGNHQSETTPIIRVRSTHKTVYIYLSKVFSSVTYATMKTHNTSPSADAFWTVGIWPVWDTDLVSNEAVYVGRLHQGIGLPLRCDVDPDRKESVRYRDIEHVRLVNLALGAPTNARCANLRATLDVAPDAFGGFIYGDRFLNSSAAHGTYHTAGDLTDIVGGRWEGGTPHKLRIVRRVGFTILAYSGASLTLVDAAATGDVANTGWVPDLMDIIGVVRSGLGTSQEGAFNTGHAWVS